MHRRIRVGVREVCSALFMLVGVASVGQAQAGGAQVGGARGASGQGGGPEGPTVAIQPLTKYVLPDQTASVMLPDGWNVTRTGIAFIRAEGPRGELAMFGVIVPAHDAPGGGPPSPSAPLSQPYSAGPADKLQQSIAWVRAHNGQSPVQVKVFSQQPFQAPAQFGHCTKMTATLGVQGMGVLDAETDFCSLPVDANGNYRNFFKIVAISPQLAATERGTVEAVLASYVLNMKAIQQRLAAQGGGHGGGSAQGGAQRSPGGQGMQGGQGGGQGMPGGQGTPGGQGQSVAQLRAQMPSYQSLQQQIDAEVKAAGFTPQMVAAMRAQANAQANAAMAPIMNQARAVDQGVDYFDRSVLRGQIPVSITNQGTFWIDPN
jgi:hypothetical protein